MDIDQARRIRACLPGGQMHPFSQQILDLYLGGDMPTSEFRRWFHMPNSNYLPVSDCIAQIMDPNYIPEAKLPAAVTLIIPHRI